MVLLPWLALAFLVGGTFAIVLSAPRDRVKCNRKHLDARLVRGVWRVE